MIRRILYSSRATEGVGMRDVHDIIRVSHNRNSKAGLTGGLIFLDGYFFQLLEGLPSAVEERYARIARDTRHQDVVIRKDETVQVPTFESDWMALRDGSQIDPQILEDHLYTVGMPREHFSGDQVFALLMACFADEMADAAS